jgi:methionine synthase II (cobalamin-independent)
MAFKPKFLATGVGSMPFLDVEHALDISFSRLSESPIWPQLPQTDLNEQMDIQYSEGIPCVVLDKEKKRIYFDTTGDYSEAFGEFYEIYMTAMDPDEGTGDCSAMAIGPEYSQGIYAAEARLQQRESQLPYFKVHTTGPCTFALNTVDETKRAIYYNEEFRDVIIKALAMKCRWQIQKFQPYAKDIICFIDEPILSAFGSSTYVSVKREDVVDQLDEMIQAVHMDGALAGVHCCGNTEWSILVDAGVDILNFDAFEFGDSITIYPESVKTLLDRGGAIAWGIVPTSEAVTSQTVESLAARLEDIMEKLVSQGIDKQALLEQAIITPSCGTGSLKPELAEIVFKLTADLSQLLRRKYGFSK